MQPVGICIFHCLLGYSEIPSVSDSPPYVGHLDAVVGLHLHTILKPLPCYLLIRHLTLEHGLFSSLHS